MTTSPVLYPDTDRPVWPWIRFNLLGSMMVDGAPATTAKLIRRVLAMIALHPGVPISFERLVDELWNDNPPPGARQSVHTYFYMIRRKHHPQLADLISARSGFYMLDVDPMAVDVPRFVALVTRAKDYLAGGQVGLADDALTAAFSVWRGPPLADVRCGPVLEAMRVDIEEYHRSARLLGVDIDMKAGRTTEAAESLASMLRAEPSREDLAGRLMLALYRSHRQVEALRVFDRVRTALREGHGLDPGPGLRGLHAQILRGDPELELNEESQ